MVTIQQVLQQLEYLANFQFKSNIDLNMRSQMELFENVM